MQKCLCVQKKWVCVCRAVVSDNTFTSDLPLRSLRSPSVSTFVQSVGDFHTNLKYIFVFFFCSLAWMLPGLVQQFVKPFVNRSWTFVVMAFELMSLLFILHCFLLIKLQIHTEKLRLALTACEHGTQLTIYELKFSPIFLLVASTRCLARNMLVLVSPRCSLMFLSFYPKDSISFSTWNI